MKKKLNTRFDLCIVTVVKDNANALERTKASLLQIPQNVQWVVQSFSSESYQEKVGANIVFNYSADTGIYNAMNEALRYWVSKAETHFYIIGTVAGPHPYPLMVRDFQAIISYEAKQQILQAEGSLPDYVVACIGGGSNALGMFAHFQ